MAVNLPLQPDGPWFEFATELEGVTYTFTFRWNDRQEAWSMDIGDGEGNLLAAGIKVVVDVPLLFTLRLLPGLPPGELMVIDTQGSQVAKIGLIVLGTDLVHSEDPGLADLGRRHTIVYLDSTDLAA